MLDINNLGERLKQEREKRGLSLDEISATTHIRRKYLEAIEVDDYSIMPGEVYLKGFIRSYADAVGLNGWDLVEEYNRSVAKEEDLETEAVGEAKQAKPETPTKSGGSLFQNPIMPQAKERYLRNKSKQDRRLMVLVAVILLAVGAYFFLVPGGVEAPGTVNNILEEESKPELALGSPEEATVLPEVSEPVQEAVTPVPSVPTVEGEAQEVVSEPVTAPVTLDLKAVADCWLEVYEDGRLAYTGVIKAGESRRFLAEQKAQIRFGNPAGVQVTHNGKTVDGLGSEVQTRVFTAYTNYTIEDLRRADQAITISEESTQASAAPQSSAAVPELPGEAEAAPLVENAPFEAGNGSSTQN